MVLQTGRLEGEGRSYNWAETVKKGGGQLRLCYVCYVRLGSTLTVGKYLVRIPARLPGISTWFSCISSVTLHEFRSSILNQATHSLCLTHPYLLIIHGRLPIPFEAM
jgi:hypothetical protein